MSWGPVIYNLPKVAVKADGQADAKAADVEAGRCWSLSTVAHWRTFSARDASLTSGNRWLSGPTPVGQKHLRPGDISRCRACWGNSLARLIFFHIIVEWQVLLFLILEAIDSWTASYFPRFLIQVPLRWVFALRKASGAGAVRRNHDQQHVQWNVVMHLQVDCKASLEMATR